MRANYIKIQTDLTEATTYSAVHMHSAHGINGGQDVCRGYKHTVKRQLIIWKSQVRDYFIKAFIFHENFIAVWMMEYLLMLQ